MKPLNYEETFPKTIPIPAALVQFRDWLQKFGYPISGCFKLRADYYGAIQGWFGTDSILNRFAMFGAGADGSPYSIWVQDDGRMPIVHMGSEGSNNFVLAPTLFSFFVFSQLAMMKSASMICQSLQLVMALILPFKIG